jgi:hypothetical protein
MLMPRSPVACLHMACATSRPKGRRSWDVISSSLRLFQFHRIAHVPNFQARGRCGFRVHFKSIPRHDIVISVESCRLVHEGTTRIDDRDGAARSINGSTPSCRSTSTILTASVHHLLSIAPKSWNLKPQGQATLLKEAVLP